MNTIEKLDNKECCGCSSCVQKCPQNAITMIENQEGFLYPVIDKNLCINCGLCAKVCPQLNELQKNAREIPKIYAMYNKDYDELLKSSSGGVFSVIANYVIEKGGIVFGAAYDKNFNVYHIKVEDKKELSLLQKSKYVQSNINITYKEAEKFLKNGKLVLFTGTPCQIAGLRSYLIQEYDNLITCDLVCHGVPSPKSFSKYLEYLEKKVNSKIVLYDFRTKDIPEYEKLGKVVFENNKIKYLEIGLDCYYNNFLKANMLRESCYSCQYANMQRMGDFTIGDFIGAHKVQPEANNRNGLSICIINTEKGNKLFEILRQKFNIYETTEEKIRMYNSNLSYPKKRPIIRDYIYKNLNNSELFVNDLKKSMNNRLKVKLKSLIPIRLKIFLKRIGVKK